MPLGTCTNGLSVLPFQYEIYTVFIVQNVMIGAFSSAAEDAQLALKLRGDKRASGTQGTEPQ